MFLKATLEKNPELVAFAEALHRTGRIAPNTYVIDITAVKRNADLLAEEARAHHLSLFAMLKQLAYEPTVSQTIASRVPQSVSVDWMGVEKTLAMGVGVGHVGHLVPVPQHLIEAVMARAQPAVWTVFDSDTAAAVGKTARNLGCSQDVLLRVTPHPAAQFPGQEGGVDVDQVVDLALRCQEYGLHVVGVTSFPCIAWDDRKRTYAPTPNLGRILEAANRLVQAGFVVRQINAPGNSCVESFPLLERYGVTHAEPGHAFTGTNPGQAFGVGAEIPAVVYVSEISTRLPDGRTLGYGGGVYPRAQARHAKVGPRLCRVSFPDPRFIDYQFSVKADGVPPDVGETVVMAFRFQLFVVRSHVVVVERQATEWTIVASRTPAWG